MSRTALVQALTCLVNHERLTRGLVALRPSVRLTYAANSHSRDMVDHHYFSHTSLSGRTATDRVQAAGYLAHARRWTVGENLAWGTYEYSSPKVVVRSWLGSPGHRMVLLHPRFRELGIGLSRGVPYERFAKVSAAATWTLLAGIRE